MSELTVQGFQKEYQMLTTEYEKNHKHLYDLGILLAYSSELKNGFMVKRQLKTTKKGTKFNYVAITSVEEFKEYEENIHKMLANLDKKLLAMDIKSLANELISKSRDEVDNESKD